MHLRQFSSAWLKETNEDGCLKNNLFGMQTALLSYANIQVNAQVIFKRKKYACPIENFSKLDFYLPFSFRKFTKQGSCHECHYNHRCDVELCQLTCTLTICKYFLTVYRLSFHFVYGFLFRAKAYKFDQVPFAYFCFYFLCLGRLTYENIAMFYVRNVFPIFFSRSFSNKDGDHHIK